MTALQFEKRYHELVVCLDGGATTTVDVHRYQNNDESLKSDPHLGNREALRHKDRLVEKMKDQIKQEKKAARVPAPAALVGTAGGGPFSAPLAAAAAEVAAFGRAFGAAVHLKNADVLDRLKPTMMAVHSGKGSPDEIASALHLVARYKLYDRTIADPAAGVRDYCDRYIGLDCNGFVGNYARAAGRNKTPSTPIPSFAPKTQRRTRIEDVQADDVMVWTDFGHITVLDSIGPLGTGPDGKPARDAVVVESSAHNPSNGASTAHGGLQHSTYSIRGVGGDGVFLVERPKGGPRVRVYIAPLA